MYRIVAAVLDIRQTIWAKHHRRALRDPIYLRYLDAALHFILPHIKVHTNFQPLEPPPLKQKPMHRRPDFATIELCPS